MHFPLAIYIVSVFPSLPVLLSPSVKLSFSYWTSSRPKYIVWEMVQRSSLGITFRQLSNVLFTLFIHSSLQKAVDESSDQAISGSAVPIDYPSSSMSSSQVLLLDLETLHHPVLHNLSDHFHLYQPIRFTSHFSCCFSLCFFCSVFETEPWVLTLKPCNSHLMSTLTLSTPSQKPISTVWPRDNPWLSTAPSTRAHVRRTHVRWTHAPTHTHTHTHGISASNHAATTALYHAVPHLLIWCLSVLYLTHWPLHCRVSSRQRSFLLLRAWCFLACHWNVHKRA